MKNLPRTLAAVAVATSLSVSADTLELADGSLLEGDFVGSSNGILMFDTGEGIEAYPEAEVIGVFLSAGVETAMREAQQTAPASATVPAGTRLVVRMVESVDTQRHAAGHRFRAQLESALAVNGQTVVPRGTVLYGTVAGAQQSGRLAGSSQLSLEFTDIMIDDRLVPIATGTLSAQGGNEAGRTVGRTARAAAVGGLIKGSKGAKRGAKIGAGASILTSGASVNVPRGTLLETNLRTPLTVPL